jgi:hypothetical protein
MKYSDICLIGIFVKYMFKIFIHQQIIVIVISVWYYCTHDIYFSVHIFLYIMVYKKIAIYRERKKRTNLKRCQFTDYKNIELLLDDLV